MAKFGVILPAAGKSSRFSQNNRKKPFLELQGRAVWLRSVEHFVNRDDVAQVIVVISPEDREFFELKFQANLAFLDIEVIDGGAERADSVYNGLKKIKADIDYVAVHDAARPLLVKKWVDNVFQAAIESDAAILGTPVTSTLKKANRGVIEKTVSRDSLCRRKRRRCSAPNCFAKRIPGETTFSRPTKRSWSSESATKFALSTARR